MRASWPTPVMTIDLALLNGRIVDGTGAPWYRGHVGIRDGHIDRIDRGTAHRLSAETEVDVDGAVVCPGFIDAHSKSDTEVFADPTLEPKIRQGITTEVIGHDGHSLAPMYGEPGGPNVAGPFGGSFSGIKPHQWTWEEMAGFLDALDRLDLAPNIGTLTGYGTIRYNVLGMEDGAVTETDIQEMGDLLEESLKQGSLGLSSALIYPPQMYADREELKRVAGRLAAYGRPFISHVRSQGRGIWDAADELYDLSVETAVPVQHTHVQLSGEAQHGGATRIRNLMDAARDRGGDVSANQHPYKAGGTRLSSLLPPWLLSQDADYILEQLRDPDVREDVRRDIEEWRLEGWENLAGLTGWDDVVIASVHGEEGSGFEGRSLADIAAVRDQRPIDALCDILLEVGYGVDILLHKLAETDIETFLEDERISFCTDGLFGDHPHPRTYGTYPRILGEYVRERNRLSVESAVRRMTSLPARTYGLDRRGILRPGMIADLVVFDLDTVASPATYEEPTRVPRGISHVIVNGSFVIAEGEPTDRTPGRVIRHDAVS